MADADKHARRRRMAHGMATGGVLHLRPDAAQRRLHHRRHLHRPARAGVPLEPLPDFLGVHRLRDPGHGSSAARRRAARQIWHARGGAARRACGRAGHRPVQHAQRLADPVARPLAAAGGGRPVHHAHDLGGGVGRSLRRQPQDGDRDHGDGHRHDTVHRAESRKLSDRALRLAVRPISSSASAGAGWSPWSAFFMLHDHRSRRGRAKAEAAAPPAAAADPGLTVSAKG